ncbi:MAG: prepilin peptidase [Betaproteobacteria bacterium]
MRARSESAMLSIDWNFLLQSMPEPWMLGAAAFIGLIASLPLARLTRRLPQRLFDDWAQAQADGNAQTDGHAQTDGQAQRMPQEPAASICFVPLKGLAFVAFTTGPIAVSLLALIQHGLALETAALCLLGWTLWVLAWIDVETRLLPDMLTLGLMWAGLLFNCAELFAGLDQAVIGAAAGYCSLWLLNALYKSWRGYDGMGAGDFKLLAAIGAWFGYPALPAVVFIAASSGVIVGLILGFTGRREQGEAIAFGPHLCLGAACIAFAEQSLRPLLSP